MLDHFGQCPVRTTAARRRGEAGAEYTPRGMPDTITLLGACDVSMHGTTQPLPKDRRGCLLAYLAFEGGWVDRNRIALLFWPESSEHDAKRNLRQLLARTRRLPLAANLEAAVDALRWQVDSDVASFKRALGRGDHEAASELWRGPLLAGFNVYDVGAFDDWLELERERLHAAFHDTVVRSANAANEAGAFDRASHHLGRLLELEPLAEDVLQPYLRALALSGRREAALAAFERFAERLRAELGLEPLATTLELVAVVRSAGTPSVTTVAAPALSAPTGTLRPPRLVGREAEAAALARSEAPITLLAGEPGVGKSRLLHDVVGGARWTSAVEGLDGIPYHPIVALLRRAPALVANLGPYAEDVARLVPELLPDILPASVDPETSKGRLVEALARALEAAPDALVIDDLQWADAATLELVGYLAQRGTRVYGAFRAGEVGPDLRRLLDALRGRGALREVALAPLDEAGIRALLADLTGSATGPELFSRWLWQRCGGNAMFALETLRALFEAGILRTGADGWETDVDDLTNDYGELDVPPAIAEVIRRRLGHLDPATVRLLEVAAVLGSAFDARRLTGITGLSPAATADALGEAERAGFVATGAFRHDLLRQALYGDIAPERRRALHALAADALSEADPGVVAEHWYRAGEPSRARDAWCTQATTLREGGLQHDACAILERAFERYGPGPDRAWLQVSLANAQRERSLLGDAQASLDDAQQTQHDDPDLRLALAIARASLLLVQGRLHEADTVLSASRPLVQRADHDARLDHVMLQARVAKQLVRIDEAVALLEPELAALRRGPPSVRLCQFVTSLGALRDDQGDNEAALALHREAYALADALGARYHQVDIAINLVFCLADLGRLDEAETVGIAALALGAYDNVAILRNNVASVAFSAGRFDAALEQYQVLQHEHEQPFLRAVALARSAEALVRLGRPDGVPALLDDAIAALDDTDYAVATGRVIAAVLELGDDAQVARLRQRVPELDPASIPMYQRDDVVRRWRERIGVTPT